MEEIWKPIKGYEGYYEISNYGNVKGVDRYIKNKWGTLTLWKGRLLKLKIDDDGYNRVGLYKNGKYSNYGVHRLVAEAFIPNQNNLPQINHKNENKTDNFVYVNSYGTVNIEKSNLEWCTNEYNLKYGHRLEKAQEKRKIPILQFTKELEFVAYYKSATDAALINGFDNSNITWCAKGHLKSAYGYVWLFAN